MEIEIPFGAKDSELQEWSYTIPKGYTAEIKDGKITVKLVKNEDNDEKIRKIITLALIASEDELSDFYSVHNITRKECTDWLEKQKEQKSKWSEEDERMLSRCIKSVESSKNFAETQTFKEAKDKEKDWLKSLPERLNLQPKQEWSDEDELMRTAVIQTLETLGGRGTTGMQIDWMKSLRPQSHWRPSEEQMGRLISIVSALRKDDCDDMADAIAEIYHGLEKMM